MKAFGEYVKQKRLQWGLTLREFCRLTGVDPSNWSKIEKGVLAPPKSKEVLVSVAETLNFTIGSEDWNTLQDLAIVGRIPKELISDQSIIQKLPIFFRTVRGDKPTEKDLEELVKILRED